MKRFALLAALLVSLFAVSTANACPHVAAAGGLCTNCYNQAVAGYTATYGTAPIPVAAQSYGAYGDAEKVTTTTVTERVVQAPPPVAAASGLIVKEEYVQPQTTYLVPSVQVLGAVNTYGTGYGNTGFGAFGTTHYGGFGNFGAGYGHNGNFGAFRGNYGHNGNFGNFGHNGSFGNRNFGNFRGGGGNGFGINANFRSGHGNNRNFRAQGNRPRGIIAAVGNRVQNTVNAALGRR